MTVVQDPDDEGSVDFLAIDSVDSLASILVDIDETSITIQEPLFSDPFHANNWVIILDFKDTEKIVNVSIVTDTFDGAVTVSFTDTTITILSPPFGFLLDGDDQVTLDVELGK